MNEEENIEKQTTGNEQLANDENISPAETEPLNIKPLNDLNDNMEVHKHPHHITHKKKWGEYLLEFLMLFLAVFLGFIAENQREHVVEQSRAKEFSRALLHDMQNDVASIDSQKKSTALYIGIADSLLKLSHTVLEGRNAAKFSFYTRFTYWTVPISWSRNTFEQIKNSGGLRYFKNSQLLNKLMRYDAMINDINSEADQNSARGNMLLTSINAVLDPELNHRLSKHMLASLDTMTTQTKEAFFSYQTESLENKRKEIRELVNMVIVQQRNMRFQMTSRWPRAQVLATELINDLEKEYHLE